MSARSRHHSGLVIAWGLPLLALVLAFVLFTPLP